MDNIVEITELDRIIGFGYRKGMFSIDKNVLRKDEEGYFIPFPLNNSSLKGMVIENINVIAMKKDDVENDEEGKEQHLVTTYCFEIPYDMYFNYDGLKEDAPDYLKEMMNKLIIRDQISYNDPGRINCFISIIGEGDWKLEVDYYKEGKRVKEKLVIPSYRADKKSKEYKDFLTTLKSMNIRIVKNLRF